MEKFKIPLLITGKLGMNKIYSGTHYQVRNSDKNYIFTLVKSIVKKRKIPYGKPVSLKMSFNSKLDVSNHAYLFKMIEDSLVKQGVLVNDTDKYVKQVVMEKHNDFQGVIVEIREV